MRTLKIYALLLATFLIGGSKSFAQCTFAVITGQPSPVQVCTGGSSTAVFSITATGTSLLYQWQANTGSGYTNIGNSALYSGVTTPTLTVTNPTLSMTATDYRCTAIAGCGGPIALSNGVSLLVYTPLSISTQPQNQTVCPGGNTSFTVTAGAQSGNSAITYQWQQNINNGGWNNVTNTGIYSGATTYQLSLTAVPANTFIDYRCFIQGPCNPGGVMTITASVSTNALVNITAQPAANVTVCPTQNAIFGVTATGTGLTYQWQESTGGPFANISNSSSGYVGPNTNTLTVVGVQSSYAGRQYRCVVTDICGTSSTSSASTLGVNSAPTMTVQPLNVTTCQGTNASFTVAATGSPNLAYQWQQWNGSAYVNVPNNATYQGSTGTTLTIVNVTPAMNITEYRCAVLGACAPGTASNAAILTVQNAPSISVQPVDMAVCAPGTAGFAVQAAGQALTYQWQGDNGVTFVNLNNAGIYSGVNTALLTITGATVANNGSNYRCVIIGGCAPSIISNQAKLTVNTTPSINTQPANTMVCENGNTSITVGATGSGLTYQWQSGNNITWTNLSNTAPYSGVNSASLNITSAPLGLNGVMYRCIVSGTCPSSQLSAPVTLTVNQLPVVNSNPSNATVCAGASPTFTVGAAAGGIFYQWQVSNGGPFSNIVGATAPYSGNTSATLTVQSVTPGMSGLQYRCIVNGTCNAPATSGTATLTVNSLPTVIVNPTPVTTCSGTTINFSTVGSATGLLYQWQENNGSGYVNLANAGVYSGTATNTLTITGTSFAMNGRTYRAVVSGTCAPQAFTTDAVLTVNLTPSMQSQTGNSSVCAGSNITFNVTATGTGITYQWQESQNGGATFNNLTNIGVFSGTNTANLNITGALAGMNNYQYRCYMVSTCAPIMTSTAAILTVNTLPAIISNPGSALTCATYPTTFSVGATGSNLAYQWQVNNGFGFANCGSGTGYANVNTAVLTVTPPNASYNGYTFRCVVSGVCAPSQTTTAGTLTVWSLPAVTTQPTAQTTCTNGNATFTVGATGTGVGYQWQENKGSGFINLTNTGIYSGVFTAALNLTGVTFNMNGWSYRCVALGACTPFITSQSVSLTVLPLPSINNHPLDQTVCFNGSTTFSVSAGQATTYQWQEYNGSFWSNLSNVGIYSGVTTKDLVIGNIPYSNSGFQYRCVVGTTCLPNITSNPATLTVYAYPVINTQPVSVVVCEGTTAQYTVSADGLQLAYQWEVNSGSGWLPINPNPVYLGQNSATLTITNVPLSVAGNNYRCKITSNGCGTVSYTTTVSVGVNPQTYIITNPVQQFTAYHAIGKYKFFVKAGGTAPFTYQWQADTTIAGVGTYVNINNNTVYSGTTSDTLTITNPPYYLSSKRYRCIVTGACAPSATSTMAQMILFWATGVNNVANTTEVKLFPNPVTGNQLNLMIGDAVSREISVRVTNNMGSLMVNQTVTLDNSNSATINIGDLAAGVYSLQVSDKDNNQMKTIRFVKQ